MLGTHAYAMVRTIKRHLESGYQPVRIEAYTQNGRIDLVFVAPDGRKRISEVKSGREITEADRIQAALYWVPDYEEVVVSTRHTDMLLSPAYVDEVRAAARITTELLSAQPHLAATRFTPHAAACRYCANHACPFAAASWLADSL
jgi:hypothetical protein